MAITTGLKKSDGTDLGNNLFAGNGTNNGNQTFNIIQSNGVDIGKGWYNKSSCSAVYGNVGFKNSSGVDIGTLLGKYGTLNCDCDTNCNESADGCFVEGCLLTNLGLLSVSLIKEGMFIWGADEKWHPVLGVAKNTLGNRKVYCVSNKGLVTSDHVIYQGECAYSPDLQATNNTSDKELIASNGIKGIYAVPSRVLQIDGAVLLSLSKDTPTYSPICDKSFIGFFNDQRVLIAGKIE